MTKTVDPRRARLAGWVYAIIGSLLVLRTLLQPELARPERRSDLVLLLIGLPFLYGFAALIAHGRRIFAGTFRLLPRRSRARASALGGSWHRALLILLTMTNAVRFLVYLANASGRRPRLAPPGLEATEPNPSLWIEVIAMAGIVAALAWSARRVRSDAPPIES